MLNNQKENKEFLGKEEMGITAASDEGIMPYVDANDKNELKIRKIPQRLAAKMAGVNVGSTYEPIINNQTDAAAYQKALNEITGNHSISFKTEYCQNQGDSGQCASYSIAIAKSIIEGKLIPQSEIGDNPDFATHGATRIWKTAANDGLTESEILLAIDAQLTMGRPAIVQCRKDSNYSSKKNAHWAVVVSKSGSQYTIIDPITTKEGSWTCSLSKMQWYNSSIGLTGYAIFSTELY